MPLAEYFQVVCFCESLRNVFSATQVAIAMHRPLYAHHQPADDATYHGLLHGDGFMVNTMACTKTEVSSRHDSQSKLRGARWKFSETTGALFHLGLGRCVVLS